MEIAILNKGTLKIKSKNATLIVDPSSLSPKTDADAILFLSKQENDLSKIQNYRLVVKGAGEYEAGGIKISAANSENELVYTLDVDSVKVLIGSSNAVNSLREKLSECQIAVLNANEDFNESIVSSLEPQVLIIYGEKSEDALKKIGKTEVAKTNKYSTTAEKLPQELEVINLE